MSHENGNKFRSSGNLMEKLELPDNSATSKPSDKDLLVDFGYANYDPNKRNSSMDRTIPFDHFQNSALHCDTLSTGKPTVAEQHSNSRNDGSSPNSMLHMDRLDKSYQH